MGLYKTTFLAISGLLLISGCQNESLNPILQNQDPVIHELIANPTVIQVSGISIVSVQAADPDSDTLIYIWISTRGQLNGEGASVTWIAPTIPGIDTITVLVNDGKDGEVSKSLFIQVEQILDSSNNNPVIASITASEDTSNT